MGALRALKRHEAAAAKFLGGECRTSHALALKIAEWEAFAFCRGHREGRESLAKEIKQLKKEIRDYKRAIKINVANIAGRVAERDAARERVGALEQTLKMIRGMDVPAAVETARAVVEAGQPCPVHGKRCTMGHPNE
jgi:hypothetical protein